MKVVVVNEVRVRRHTRDEKSSSSRRGETVGRAIFRDVTPDGLHFWFGYGGSAKTDDSFTAPRHHHALQQIRWSDSGSKNYAPGKNIEGGDLAYFPRGAYYGPENKAGPYVGFSTQFGFGNENMIGPYRRPLLRQAKQRLRSAARSPTACSPASTQPPENNDVTTPSRPCTKRPPGWREGRSPPRLPDTRNRS